MSEERTRRLSAIMFTDMVGYTALMQEDESSATTVRDRHRTVLRESIEEHQGEIVQFYGDGTLSVFPSAVQAVDAAVDTQRRFQLDRHTLEEVEQHEQHHPIGRIHARSWRDRQDRPASRGAGREPGRADAATAWMLRGLWTFLSSKSPRARVGRRGWFLSSS